MQDEHVEVYYQQDTEIRLLATLLECLDDKTVVDVGAEHGSFTEALLRAGASTVYAFEPYPMSVDLLKGKFHDEPTVHVFGLALGASNGQVTLHVVEDKSGHIPDAYHSLVAFKETPTLRPVGEILVECCTLDSLVVAGSLPAQVGILKIDTERSDFAVLQGMGRLSSLVVMVEFWEDLPETVGPAAYRVSEVATFMAERGYSNFAVIKRYDQFETFQINSAETRSGDWGNVLFIHDSAFSQLSPVLFEMASAVHTRLLDKASSFANEAQKRGDLLEEMHHIAEDRRAVIENLQRTLDEADGQRATILLEVLTEQEKAVEAYLRASRDDGLWKQAAPQLGVLYQHDPAPFHVPEHYLDIIPLANPPRISITTPCLNAARFLPFTLDSVLDQQYANLEYVVQDGASTDDTLILIEQYRNRLAHVASEKDSGMAQAINRGFAHTSGEIMAYLNADDLLLPGALHYVAAYFARHPEVDVIYGHRVLINEHNAEVGRWILPAHDNAVLSWADYVPQETLFWRRSIWEKSGGNMDESFRFALDWDLLIRFRDAGARMVRLPRFLGAFRVHAAQKTSLELEHQGAHEMEYIREREAGRPVSHSEIWHYLGNYMRHHKLYHKLYRLGVLLY
ncbi:MAG: FkbM family methyltransferase [Chloroflexi bacterium]|nr:FkbM family methyltransferase [Chloroflexota bacterium]